MKKFIIITIAFILICITPLLIYHFSTLPPKETIGTLVGEVFVVYNGRYLYLKPMEDQDVNYLLKIEITDETLFASQSSIASSEEIPELAVGKIIEVDYTYKRDTVEIRANSIKEASAGQGDKWPEVTLKEDYLSGHYDIGMLTSGNVVYVTKLTSPTEGYLVYIDDNYTQYSGRLYGYFLEKNNKFLQEDLRQLLEQEATGYAVKVRELNTLAFSCDLPALITGAHSIELAEE